jgi:hypothetical protein
LGSKPCKFLNTSLPKSNFAVVVLTPTFFCKPFTQAPQAFVENFEQLLGEEKVKAKSTTPSSFPPLHDFDLLFRQPIKLIHQRIDLPVRRLDLAVPRGFLVLDFCRSQLLVQGQHALGQSLASPLTP